MGAMNLPITPTTYGTDLESRRQVPVSEGARSLFPGTRRHAQAPMDVLISHLPG